MTAVNRVVIQIRRPSGTDPGQVSTGYFIIEDGVLIMTQPDGEPVSPDQFRHTLKAGDDPNAIAGVLTRLVRRSILGISEAEEAFGRPLGYSNAGIV